MHISEKIVTVVITNYNYEKYVIRAIDSVLKQSRSDVDLIVVDDGSTDRSWELIRQTEVEKVFRVKNGGAAAACLYALGHTSSPFILVLDADDELIPGSLQLIISQLDESVSKLQYSLLPIDENNNVIGDPFPDISNYRLKSELVDEILKTGFYNTPPTSGNVFRRDVIERLAEVDYEMSVDGVTLFIAPFFGHVVNIHAPLGYYRIHGKQFSQSGNRPSASRFKQEADRFVVRLNHLYKLVLASGQVYNFPDPKLYPFYMERKLYVDIMENQRFSLLDVLTLIANLSRSRLKIKNKIGVITTLFLYMIVGNDTAKRILKYRIGTGPRGVLGLLSSILKR